MTFTNEMSMSAFGPKRTGRSASAAAAFGGKHAAPLVRPRGSFFPDADIMDALFKPLPHRLNSRARRGRGICVYQFIIVQLGNNSFDGFTFGVWKCAAFGMKGDHFFCFTDRVRAEVSAASHTLCFVFTPRVN